MPDAGTRQSQAVFQVVMMPRGSDDAAQRPETSRPETPRPETPRPELSALQAEVARRILERIGDGRWKPGERCPELALAKALGVSRTPVRRALELLEAEGLIAQSPGRSFRLLDDPAAIADAVARVEALLPTSDAERVYQQIIADKAQGRIAQDVSEAELLPRYDVSHGTLRRVLIRLSAEGLVARQPGHGWRFADSLDDDDAVSESYAFRIAVECQALAQPGYRVDEERFREVRAAHMQVLASDPAGLDERDWFRVNSAFHEAIVAGARNRFFDQAIAQQNNLRRIQEREEFRRLPADRVVQSCCEHLAILNAIETGNRRLAAALLRHHLAEAAEFTEDEGGPADGFGRL
ncbi:GntR family transcriptional regulator (plasmid) [Tistrella bauzanensis]|uniref:GntR family transcriptional regulator n=1 Tax=Tistrella TaxID=171436 RepID=UPI0031F6EC5F